jgi:hypothetical protein
LDNLRNRRPFDRINRTRTFAPEFTQKVLQNLSRSPHIRLIEARKAAKDCTLRDATAISAHLSLSRSSFNCSWVLCSSCCLAALTASSFSLVSSNCLSLSSDRFPSYATKQGKFSQQSIHQPSHLSYSITTACEVDVDGPNSPFMFCVSIAG